MSEINAESTTMPPVELRMPRASEREEMLAGKLYNSVDPELNALREKAGDLCARFNAASRTDHAACAGLLPGDDWRRRAVRPERFAAATDASVALAGS